MTAVKKVAKHLKTYLLVYALAAMLAGLVLGYKYQAAIETHKGLVKDLIVFFAVLTIYPSMIQLRVTGLGEAARRVNAIAAGLVAVFAVSPLLAMLLASVLGNKHLELGFVLTNIVPASSASIGYVLLAGGSIELATILALVSLFGAFAAVPGYMALYARLATIHVPIGAVAKSMALTLLAPLVAGQLTRYILIHHRAQRAVIEGRGNHKCLERLRNAETMEGIHGLLVEIENCIARRLEEATKPHLSLWTMASMLVLIALLVASKAGTIVAKPGIALNIFLLEAGILATLLAAVTLLDMLLGLGYEEHVAVAFLSATKNASVAAAIAVMALGPLAALPAALIPVIQAPIAIMYLQLVPRLRPRLQRGALAVARAAE